MGWIWRALIAALLLGGTVAVVPGIETYASGGLAGDGSDVLRPAPNDNCPSSNPRKQKKCHYNNQDNFDDNASSTVLNTDGTGASVNNGSVTIDLWRSAEKPVANAPFRIGITGNGAPISSIEWWADSPNPAGDDIGAAGHVVQDCGGAQPCQLGQDVVARNVGWYVLHARVTDTSGNQAGTDWQFLASETARG